MKVKILFLMVMTLMSFMIAGCNGTSQNNASSNQSNDKIIIGIDEEFPPFGFKDDNGDIVGFDVEMAKETMHRMGREVEFKPIDWDNKENELNTNAIDMIWNGLEITEDRKQYMIFSKPYMYSGFIVFARSDNADTITNKSSLVGLNVGIQGGSSAEMYINNDNELRSHIKNLKLYKDNSAMINALLNGEIDAMIADETNGLYYIFKNNLGDKIEALNISIGEEGKLAIGFRKKDISLLQEVQNALDEVIKDGTAERISKRWFGKDMIVHN